MKKQIDDLEINIYADLSDDQFIMRQYFYKPGLEKEPNPMDLITSKVSQIGNWQITNIAMFEKEDVIRFDYEPIDKNQLDDVISELGKQGYKFD